MSEEIIRRDIETELQSSYLTYAMSVIISRALPDVRDGLKPVHRRILYSMYKNNLFYNQKYKKCASVVGDVLAKYHPHGDLAVYDSLVRMAQTFSLRETLIDGQGNFGSVDGDPPAAYRYTECRMTKLSDEMLKDIKKETVDFVPNFDESIKEPKVLPAGFPNLLVNGVSGIAVGMATYIPPHNIVEVIDAAKYYIDHRDCGVAELIKFIQGPDVPTGGYIYGHEGIKRAYLSGKGKFTIRSKVTIEEFKKDREAIIVTEIPYQVNKSEMIKKIAHLVRTEVIKGISDTRDESGRDGIRVVVELKKGVNANTILNQLYKYTTLENNYSINMLAIVQGEPRQCNLKEVLAYFVNHRFDVETRRVKYDLAQAEARAHILEGLIKAVGSKDVTDEIVSTIRESQTVANARENLMTRFDFSEKQAQAILDMRLARLVALEIRKLKEEYEALRKAILEYRELLADKEKMYTLIKNDLTLIADEYGNPRRTQIIKEKLEEFEDEDFIQKTNTVVSLTNSGYIKRLPVKTYKSQSRGGVGVSSTKNRDEDEIVSLLFVATTHDTVMFITNKGRAYYSKVHEIPEAGRIAKGTHVKMIFSLDAGEKIQGYLTFSSFEESKNFIIASSSGMVKKCNINDFINAKKRGVQAINLKNNDTIVGAIGVDKESDVFIGTRHGLGLRINESQIRVMGRSAAGVRGIRLGTSDEVAGVRSVEEGKELLVVSEKGYGKKTEFDHFSTKGRGGKGQFYMKLSEKTGEVASINAISKKGNALIVTSSGKIIRLNSEDINTYGRTAAGTSLVNVHDPDIVVNTAVIEPIEES